MSGKQSQLIPLLKFSLRKLLPFVGLCILLGLMIIGGLILLIIPGIYILFRFGLAPFVMLNEDKGVIDSIKRAGELSKGHIWELIGADSVPTLISNLITAVLLWVMMGIIFASASVTSMVFSIFVAVAILLIVGFILGIAQISVLAFRYHQISLVKSGKLTKIPTDWTNYAVAALVVITFFLPNGVSQNQMMQFYDRMGIPTTNNLTNPDTTLPDIYTTPPEVEDYLPPETDYQYDESLYN